MAYKYPSVTNKFQPKAGQTYRFIGVPGQTLGNLSFAIGRRVWAGNSIDKARLAANNVFKTIKRAKEVRAALVTTLQSFHKA